MKCKTCEKELDKRNKVGYCQRCFASLPKTEEAKKKNSESVKKAHERNPENWKGKNFGFCSNEWKKLHPEYLEKARETFRKNIASGKTIIKGHPHSKETREKLSQKATGGKDGFVKTKYYKIFCPYTDEDVTVQGTWELKYCDYLNEQKTNWVRDRKNNLRFKYSENDIKRTYFPDLYLPDLDIYIEIKGYFSEQDKLKMEKVKEYNEDKNIQILQKEDLEKLGIVLY